MLPAQKRGRVLSAKESVLSNGSYARQIKRSKVNNRRNYKPENRPIHVHSVGGGDDTSVEVPEWSPNDELEGWELEDTGLVELDDDPEPRRYNSDDPMREWVGERDRFLKEILRLEGRTSQACEGICMSCSRANADATAEDEVAAEGGEGDSKDPIFRCRECFGGIEECATCCLRRHRDLPLHFIEKWNGKCYERITLQQLGLRVQLGHNGNGEACPVPEGAPSVFTILHINGLHTVNVDYCNCDQRVARHLQLLRAGWYPATIRYPATSATFELLRHFHALSLGSKVSAYEYYLNLERLTNNIRIDVPKTRYPAFLRMVRQFRHLRMMKRGGRGHIKDGISTTGEGALAVLCAACPIEGVNLPEGWKDAPPALRFLYTLFVSVDANFRLKNRLRNAEQADPGLHTGLAYFVPSQPYNEHVLKFVSEADMSSCSSFNALSRADSKSTTGLRYTGVGMSVCSRHEMVRPMGVGDLQKGERYCNMDYIFLSALFGIGLLHVMAIYDIACQWKVNFPTRMAAFPTQLQLPPSCSLDFAVPKCHLPAHQKSCQTPHSLNLKPGVGRTDGEGIERDWSVLNAAANSTREMGQGARHDTLDDLLAYHNWQKTTGLGESLRRKYILAVVEFRRHKSLHDDFSSAIPSSAQIVWMKMVQKWEEDRSQPNPYEVPSTHETEADIKRKLLLLESKDIGVGLDREQKTASVFLSMGLLIEETQRRLRVEAKQKDMSSVQAVRLQEKRLALRRQINAYEDAQKYHMPAARLLFSPPPSNAEAEDVSIIFPSSLDSLARTNHCPHDLVAKETQLRVAQCNDALDRIRLTQRAKRQVSIHKKKQPSGQQTGTRTNAEYERLEGKIQLSKLKYRRAREALVSLLGEDVPSHLRVLRDADVCPPPAFDIERQPAKNIQQAAERLGEGGTEIPWIWRVPGVFSADDEDASLNAGLRIEWLKSRARSLRWNEEVLLVKEEMRRVRETLQHRADRWTELATQSGASPHLAITDHGTHDPRLMQGLSAYAHRQALVNGHLRSSFTSLWEKPPGKRSKHRNQVIPPPSLANDVAGDQAFLTELLADARKADVSEDEDEDGDGRGMGALADGANSD